MNPRDRRPQPHPAPQPVPGDPAQEQALVTHLVEQAARPENAGQARGRVEAKVPGPDGRVRVGHRTYHVDLVAGVLTITDAWDGVESARHTVALDDQQGQQKPGIFAPRPRRPAPAVPVRRPPDGLRTHDAETVRRAVLQWAEDEITETGALRERLVLVCDEHLEELRVDDARAADPEGGAMATLEALAGRPAVNFRVLLGDLAPEGAVRTGFALFVADGDDEGRFWLARRPFRVLGGRIGSRAEWELVNGVGWDGTWDELPAHLTASRRAWAWPAAVPVPMPAVMQGLATFPPDVRRPANAAEFTEAAAAMQEHAAWTEGLDGLLVFAFRGRDVEHYVVRGEIPFGVDDLCRAIAARSERPDAMVTMRLGMHFEAAVRAYYRAVITVADADGQRYERRLVMRWRPGAKPDDPASQIQLYGSDPKPVGDDGWIGVPPDTALELFAKDAAEA